MDDLELGVCGYIPSYILSFRSLESSLYGRVLRETGMAVLHFVPALCTPLSPEIFHTWDTVTTYNWACSPTP